MGCGASSSLSPAESVQVVGRDIENVGIKNIRIAIESDVILILTDARFPVSTIRLGDITVSDKNIPMNTVDVVRCSEKEIKLNIFASETELVSTFYWGMHNLGFFFPHPRKQISPSSIDDILKNIGKSWTWQPQFVVRGFHLHTEHPNEWVKGFLQGDENVSTDYVRWLARNQQNVFEVVLLRSVSKEDTANSLRVPFALAHSFKMRVGISVSIEFQQQKSAHLATPVLVVDKLFPQLDMAVKENEIHANLKQYTETFPIAFDFMSIDLGTTEFSHPTFDSELHLIEIIRKALELQQKNLFVKVHSSIGQTDSKYGDLNFNFIPKLSDPRVGVLPHTLHFYSLTDESTPVYGRKDYSDMLAFLRDEAGKRPVWYYPETSYWVGLDVDIPLLLTDYLTARSADIDTVVGAGVTGHLTFSSGHGNGYWLFDWTVALQSNSAYRGRPLIGLELLGEDVHNVWAKEAAFQSEFFKQKGLISILTSASPLDELPIGTRLMRRNTMQDLAADVSALNDEIVLLQAAIQAIPGYALESIRNIELRALVSVTRLRISHALFIRQALKSVVTRQQSSEEGLLMDTAFAAPTEKNEFLAQAAEVRLKAKVLMEEVVVPANESLYPAVRAYDKPFDNPTSYSFGYLWPSRSLHYWEREEGLVREEILGAAAALYMNIFNPVSIAF